jgi:hypothetical protein
MYQLLNIGLNEDDTEGGKDSDKGGIAIRPYCRGWLHHAVKAGKIPCCLGWCYRLCFNILGQWLLARLEENL